MMHSNCYDEGRIDYPFVNFTIFYMPGSVLRYSKISSSVYKIGDVINISYHSTVHQHENKKIVNKISFNQ